VDRESLYFFEGGFRIVNYYITFGGGQGSLITRSLLEGVKGCESLYHFRRGEKDRESLYRFWRGVKDGESLWIVDHYITFRGGLRIVNY